VTLADGAAAAIDIASKHQSDSDTRSHSDDDKIARHASVPNTQAPATFVHGRRRGVGFHDNWNAVAQPLSVVKAQQVSDCEITPSEMGCVE
jgi:hypothetical protein